MRYAEIVTDSDSPNFQSWFRGSQVVGPWYTPQVVYHGAFHVAGIEKFKPMTHFGTQKAANSRIKDQRYRSGRGGLDAAIYPVYLSIKQPLRIVDSKGINHSSKDIAHYLAFGNYHLHSSSVDFEARNRRYGKISLDEYSRIAHDGPDALVAVLKAHGYDGLTYKNRIEHTGSVSWVIFDPSQVWPLYSNHPG